MTRKYRVKKVKAGHTNPKKAVLNSGSSTPTVGDKVTYYVSLDSEQDDDYKSTQSRIAINQKLIKVTKRAGNRHIPLSQASKELQDFQ